MTNFGTINAAFRLSELLEKSLTDKPPFDIEIEEEENIETEKRILVYYQKRSIATATEIMEELTINIIAEYVKMLYFENDYIEKRTYAN